MKTLRYTHVKKYKRSIGKSCLRCPMSATVTAVRVEPWGMKLPVRYCDTDAVELGVIVG